MKKYQELILLIAAIFSLQQSVVAQNLFDALEKDDIERVKILITQDPGCINQIEEKSGLTPLLKSTSNGQIDICNLLIEKGADIQATDNSGGTALHLAAYYGHLEMIKLLVDIGIDANVQDNNKYTPIIWAIFGNNTNSIDELIKQGANLNPAIRIGRSVLHLAAANSNTEVIKYLLDKGLNINAKSDLFMDNAEELDIDYDKVGIVVISHEHGDHAGGLFSFLEKKHNLSVFMPFSFSYDFVRRVETYGANAITVKNPVEICKDVYLSGELEAKMINEQSLAINTKKGLVIIVGCSHPGIVNICKKFKEMLNKEIYMVFGGFHLMDKTTQEMNEIISQMKTLGVQKCGASHCTGKQQLELFKEAYGDDFVSLGVGRVISL